MRLLFIFSIISPVVLSMRPPQAVSSSKTLSKSSPITSPAPFDISDVQRKQELSDDEYNKQSRRAFLLGASTAATCMCGVCAGSSSNRKQDFFASIMSKGMQDYEALPEVKSFKTELFSAVNANDRVLEIGIGSGPNLRYYSKMASKVLALEPNSFFYEHIIKSAAAAKLSSKIEILPGYAEQIPLADNSMDVVVGTMVLCSVNSVSNSLKEVHRILKPGGRYIFTEHVAAPNNRPMLSMAQVLADPLQRMYAEGCHLRRNPKDIILETFGSENVKYRDLVLAGKTKDEGLPPHFLLSPHLIGFATKV